MKNRFLMPVAVHLFFIKDNHILLLKRYNTGYEDGNYSVIAGHLDGNEEVIAAAKREALEEAGVNLSLKDIEIISVMHRKSDDERVDYFVIVNQWTGVIKNTEPHKCSEIEWYDLDKLPLNIIPYIKRAIEAYKNNEAFISYGF